MDPLQVCCTIRDKLRESGAKELPSCPVGELLPTGPKKKGNKYKETHLLGYCHSKHTEWENETPSIQKSRKIETSLIEITLQKKDTLEPLPLLVIIPTFIHELAHSITPAKREETTNGKYRAIDYHGEEFYKNFAYLLRIAEANDIFTLPSSKNKFSMKNLLRYDSLDIVNAPLGFVGSSKLYGENKSICRDLRITLVDNGNNKQKPIFIKSTASVLDILKQAKQKFRVKYTIVKTEDGKFVKILQIYPMTVNFFFLNKIALYFYLLFDAKIKYEGKIKCFV